MRFVRIAIASLLALTLLGAVACEQIQEDENGPEATWEEFRDAVAENRPDDALDQMDLERMSERMLAEDPQMQEMAEMFGGAEGIAEILSEQLRTAIELGDFAGPEGESIVEADVTNVDVDGDVAVLTIQSGEEQGFVHMERIDGEWKIVMMD